LAADVVGYSRLMGQDEAGTLERLKTHRRELIEPLLAEHRGRIVKLMGDGVLCEFGSVVDAVACAVAIQRGMAEREAGTPEDQRIRFRIGINLGDVISEDDDIFGDGVNIAARLEGLAEPGGILISGTAFDQVEGKLPLALAFAGEQRVKNIERSVRTYRIDLADSPKARRITTARFRRWPRVAIATAAAVLLAPLAAGGAWWYWGQSVLAPPAPEAAQPLEALPVNNASLAVLPFTNMSGDTKQERLADGLTEDLITELARYRWLFVIARHSSFAYKGKARDVRQIARELGVRYLLEGSIQTDPQRVRVTAQLIDATTGTHVWSERYDRPVGEFFDLRDEITQQIAGTLTGHQGPLVTAAAEVARRKPPASLEAYEYYALARAAYGPSKEALAEVRRLSQKALDLDPCYARAWYFVAYSYFDELLLGFSGNPAETLRLFHQAADKALACDPMDSWTHFIAGLSAFKRGDRVRGAAAWERALELSPNDSSTLRLVGGNLAFALGTDRAQEGLELYKKARRLNPYMPGWMTWTQGWAQYFASQYEQAIETFQKSGETDVDTHLYLALAYAQLDRKAEASREVAEVLRQKPDFTAKGWLDRYNGAASSEALFLDGARKAGLPIHQPAPSN
jgi:TolB-like protein/class 3 adenylate cyclase/Tfp pilus assembly protein PilF